MSKPLAGAEEIPTIDDDPFSIAFLRDPYPYYERMREMGPVVWLSRYASYAVTRYDEVQEILRDWKTFSSAAGVGLANFNKEKPWRPLSPVLEADPPLHTRTRAVLNRVLGPANLRKLQDRFHREAANLVERIVAMGSFDGIQDFSTYFPLKVFCDAVGVPEAGRENVLAFSSLMLNSRGPSNALTKAAFANAGAVSNWIMAACGRDSLTADGLGAQIYAAVDDGKLSAEEAPMLVRALLAAGVDTTAGALGNLLWCLVTFQDEWEKLRHSPALIRSAFDEGLRYEGASQVLFRTTVRDVDLGGFRLRRDHKVAAFVAAANRDPHRWTNPDKFNIERRPAGHLTFGAGIHGCVGQMLARLESEILLGAFVPKIKSLRFAGTPTRQYNNVHRGFESLPIHVVPK
jgi:4-methoxybenzoate monooxygenase (O-demethylating)